MISYKNKVVENLLYSLNNYDEIIDSSNNKKKLNKINKDLNQKLNLEKDKISSYYDNNHLWDKL